MKSLLKWVRRRRNEVKIALLPRRPLLQRDLNAQVAVSVVSWIFVMDDRCFPLGNYLFEHQTSVILFISFDRSLVVELLSCIQLLRPHGLYLPGSSVHGISQARILEWVAVLVSRGSSQPRDGTKPPALCGRILYCWATRKALWKLYCKWISQALFVSFGHHTLGILIHKHRIKGEKMTRWKTLFRGIFLEVILTPACWILKCHEYLECLWHYPVSFALDFRLQIWAWETCCCIPPSSGQTRPPRWASGKRSPNWQRLVCVTKGLGGAREAGLFFEIS